MSGAHVSTTRIETASGQTIQGYGLWPHVLLRNGNKPPAFDRHPYLWVDTRRAFRHPLYQVTRDQVIQKSDDPDPLLTTSINLLKTWNKYRDITLLEAFRRTYRRAEAFSY